MLSVGQRVSRRVCQGRESENGDRRVQDHPEAKQVCAHPFGFTISDRSGILQHDEERPHGDDGTPQFNYYSILLS